MSLDVLIAVFETSYAKNDEEGEDDKTGRDGRELAEELEDGYTEEETRRMMTYMLDSSV